MTAKFQKYLPIALTVVALTLAGLVGRSTKHCQEMKNTVIIYEDSTRIDSLKRVLEQQSKQIDSLTGSVEKRQAEILKIKKRYEKTIDSINLVPDNELVDFFTNRYE